MVVRRISYPKAVFAPLLIVVANLLASSPAPAAALATPGATTRAGLAAQIDALIEQPRYAGASWGIAVTSLDSGRTLYSHRGDRLLQPASTAKLFTAALSLSSLGPNYRIPTRLLASGRIVNGRLNGPLILYGMGDPTLGSATSPDWADRLASQAAARGLRVVHGPLIADDTYFAGPAHGDGWEAQDLQSWFAVPAAALSVQENIVHLEIRPGDAIGRPAQLKLSPAAGITTLDNQLLTSGKGSGRQINLYRAAGEQTLHLFGHLAFGSRPRSFALAMTDPARVAALQLRQALHQHGITTTDEIRVVHWPQTGPARSLPTQQLGEVLSPPLEQILTEGLKRSQNLYLQNLLLSVGAREPAPLDDRFVSTEDHAIKALQQLLPKIGIAPSSSLVGEGTGLSRRDLVTPHAMVRLLGYLAAQPYAHWLHEALPIAGVDGTLLGHMRHTAAAGNVHAKTGSMTYVHCLAGYVTSAAGEHLAFAIFLNNYERPDHAPRSSHDVDAIAVLLANYRGTP